MGSLARADGWMKLLIGFIGSILAKQMEMKLLIGVSDGVNGSEASN